jgi:hypothetical protein
MLARRHVLVGFLPLLLVLGGCKYVCSCPVQTVPSVVTIDSALNAHPDPVHVRRGQWVHFFIQSGELNIEADFLEDQGHEGGQAWGRVRNDAKFGPHKYTVVNLTTGKRNDPTGMVDPDVPPSP